MVVDRMSDSVTTWVPELREPGNASNRNAVGHLRWEEITIGALASHQAGINRDCKLSIFEG
jgi:CubicO group peptidase (beta-lactamase class C family)